MIEILVLAILWAAVIMGMVAIFIDQHKERRRSEEYLHSVAAEQRKLAARKARVEAEIRRALEQNQMYGDPDEQWREVA